MKIIWQNNNFTLYIYKKYQEVNIKNYLKNILIIIKNKYQKKISGFYKVVIYPNDIIGMIIDFTKEDDLDFFDEIVDLDIEVSDNKNVYLEFDDPFIIDNNYKLFQYKNKFYLNIDNLTINDYYKFIEFSKLKYGDETGIISKKNN